MSSGVSLVIGADSRIGARLVDVLAQRGRAALATTRRPGPTHDSRIFFDLESGPVPALPDAVEHAFLLAGVTDLRRCEQDPVARRINAELLPAAASRLLEQGRFVTFVSTNAVFGGTGELPAESDPHAPASAYAEQKSAAERAITRDAETLGASDRFNIVRLTKVIGPGTPPLPSWLGAWTRGEACRPFADLTVAPISLRFAAQALADIGESRVPGQLHLSGAADVSYVQVAERLAEHLGVAQSLISPTTSAAEGIEIEFRLPHTALAMPRTTSLTGLRQQTLDQVAADLSAEIAVGAGGAVG